MRKQISYRISESLATRLKMDIVRLGVTGDSYAGKAFEKFLSLPIETRRAILGDMENRKIVGRKADISK